MRFRTPRLFWPLILAGVLISPPSSAGGPGTSAAPVLKLGFGARPIGLGEAFVSVANDVSALHYNPAGLAYPAFDDGIQSQGRYEALASQAILVQGVSMTQLGLVRRPFGLSLTHMTLGGIEQRTAETADPEGKFGASSLALGASYGRMVGPIGVGATAKLIRETIGSYSASALALDLGALHRFEKVPVSVGISVANLGRGLRYIDLTSPLPTIVRVGASYGMTRAFPHTLSLQLDFPRDSGVVMRLGGEYLGFGPIALRGGYQTVASDQRQASTGKALGSTASGLTNFYGLFVGAGLRTKYGNLDYALVPYGELGTAHRLSFSLKFGSVAVNK